MYRALNNNYVYMSTSFYLLVYNYNSLNCVDPVTNVSKRFTSLKLSDLFCIDSKEYTYQFFKHIVIIYYYINVYYTCVVSDSKGYLI